LVATTDVPALPALAAISRQHLESINMPTEEDVLVLSFDRERATISPPSAPHEGTGSRNLLEEDDAPFSAFLGKHVCRSGRALPGRGSGIEAPS
jgi:hypothetical protein